MATWNVVADITGPEGPTGPDVVLGDQNGTRIWRGTQSAYDAIGTKDSDTVYVVKG